jgi:hypothetical protein
MLFHFSNRHKTSAAIFRDIIIGSRISGVCRETWRSDPIPRRTWDLALRVDTITLSAVILTQRMFMEFKIRKNGPVDNAKV